MNRLDIINHFVEKYNYIDYCEIGIFTGFTLNGCKAKNKIGIDPECQHYQGTEETLCQTSDIFFRNLPEDKKFQIIFIDGLHEAAQVYRDIHNSLKHLSGNGTIILHDMNPPLFQHTTTGIDGNWTGDTYKAILRFQGERFPGNYKYSTVDTDWGVGILHKTKGLNENKNDRNSYYKAMEDWDFFTQNRNSLLNVISVEQFKQIYI